MLQKMLTLITFSTSFALAHSGHDHSPQPPPSTKLAPSAQRPSVTGQMFEIVIEVCSGDKTLFYIADSQSNQAITDAQIEIIASGDITATAKGEPTKSAGIYQILLKSKEGSKVKLEAKVTTPKMSETLIINVPHWPQVSEACSQ
jgi:hypothetical protein